MGHILDVMGSRLRGILYDLTIAGIRHIWETDQNVKLQSKCWRHQGWWKSSTYIIRLAFHDKSPVRQGWTDTGQASYSKQKWSLWYHIQWNEIYSLQEMFALKLFTFHKILYHDEYHPTKYVTGIFLQNQTLLAIPPSAEYL